MLYSTKIKLEQIKIYGIMFSLICFGSTIAYSMATGHIFLMIVGSIVAAGFCYIDVENAEAY